MAVLLRSPLALLAVLLLIRGAHGEEWGTLSGRFVVEGKVPPPAVMAGRRAVLAIGPQGELKNALIVLRTKDVAVAPSYAAAEHHEVTLEIKNGQCNPRVVTMRTSQALRLVNSDAINYNPSLSPLLNPPLLVALKAGQSAQHFLPREEPLPVRIGDNIVPWLVGWVVVRDNPYAATSDSHGKFSLRDLPAGGPLQFRLWHEKCGYLKRTSFRGGATDDKGSFKVTITPGQNDLGDIVVPATALE